MKVRNRMLGAGAACLLSWTAMPALAGETPDATAQRLQELEARMQQLQAENHQMQEKVVRMEAERGDTWLNERRAAEVKALVAEVLSDADTRASLLADGMTAGHNGKHFYLAAADGSYLMQIEGQVQARYIYDKTDSDKTAADDDEGGFTMRRTKLGFFGHIIDPTWQYKVKAAFDRDGGAFLLEESYIKKKLDNQYVHYVQVGQFKGRFMHEELVSSSKQMAVERSNVNEFFTLDYSQGVEIGAQYDKINWSVIAHDGREGDNVDFAADSTDFAVAGRAEYLAAGNWKQFEDFATWSKDSFGVLIGAGFDYEAGESGKVPVTDWTRMFQYTVDASVEFYPFTLYGAFLGRHMVFDSGAGVGTNQQADQWGAVVQGSYMVIADKMDIFARYEYLDFDSMTELTGVSAGGVAPLVAPNVGDHQSIIALGTNYYFKKHDLKLTADVLWAPDGIRAGESGGGNITSNGDETDQFSFRGQLQLLF